MPKSKKHLEIPHHTDHEGEPRNIDAIRARANLDLVDITVGPMTSKQLTDEITRKLFQKSPEYMVVLIEKNKVTGKYHSAIYITKKDFDKPIKQY